jgi:5'-nucleotidase (lipoprotein e(P4) family)
MCRLMKKRVPAMKELPAQNVLLALLAAMLFGCVSAPSNTEPATDEVVHGALHWGRNSAEHRALYEQTFRLAAEHLDELAQKYEPGTWAVSADADETLIDNSQFEIEIRKKGDSYNQENWDDWVRREAAPATPGAVEFARHVKNAGGYLAVVTNRRTGHCAPTAENLRREGIVFDIVLCRTDDGEKEPRWDAIANGTASQWPEAQPGQNPIAGPVTIVMWLGDNIGDFPDHDQEIRRQEDPILEYGDRYFVFPNPVYGSWEANPKQ